MKDISGVVKVVEHIDQDVKETNLRVDRQTKEFKRLESKFDDLVDYLTFLEQANIEKEVSGQTSMVKVTLELGQRRLGN